MLYIYYYLFYPIDIFYDSLFLIISSVSNINHIILWKSFSIYTTVTYFLSNLIVFSINIFKFKNVYTPIINVSIKFIILITLLVFIRGGIPRYRYDFLTKIGWIKFLSLILGIFLNSLLLIYLY